MLGSDRIAIPGMCVEVAQRGSLAGTNGETGSLAGKVSSSASSWLSLSCCLRRLLSESDSWPSVLSLDAGAFFLSLLIFGSGTNARTIRPDSAILREKPIPLPRRGLYIVCLGCSHGGSRCTGDAAGATGNGRQHGQSKDGGVGINTAATTDDGSIGTTIRAVGVQPDSNAIRIAVSGLIKFGQSPAEVTSEAPGRLAQAERLDGAASGAKAENPFYNGSFRLASK
jgi:hypothetical protein